MRLVYSRQHMCHGLPMIWQPAARSWYCPVRKCHRREGPNEYGTATRNVPQPTAPVGEMVNQPEPA